MWTSRKTFPTSTRHWRSIGFAEEKKDWYTLFHWRTSESGRLKQGQLGEERYPSRKRGEEETLDVVQEKQEMYVPTYLCL